MSTIDIHLPHGNSVTNRPTLIVIHAMGEYIKDGRSLYAPEFLNLYGLSAHALVAPNGDIIRCRSDDETAWHARGHNTNSLGIEFLCGGRHDYASFVEAIKHPYLTQQQYSSGVEQVRSWMELYGIKRVARHSDLSPGRKVDPGNGFPWQDFLHDIGGEQVKS